MKIPTWAYYAGGAALGLIGFLALRGGGSQSDTSGEGDFPALMFTSAAQPPIITGGSGGGSSVPTPTDNSASTIADAIAAATAAINAGALTHYSDNATLLFSQLPEMLAQYGGGSIQGDFGIGDSVFHLGLTTQTKAGDAGIFKPVEPPTAVPPPTVLPPPPPTNTGSKGTLFFEDNIHSDEDFQNLPYVQDYIRQGYKVVATHSDLQKA